MELFKRRLLQFKEEKTPLAPAPPRPSATRLDQLPPEILLEVISYLKTNPLSLITFSLSCKRISRLIGSQPIKSHIYRTLDLVELLVRDLPTHIICPYCLKLHRVKVEVKMERRRKERGWGFERVGEERRTVGCWRSGVERRVDVDELQKGGPVLRRVVCTRW